MSKRVHAKPALSIETVHRRYLTLTENATSLAKIALFAVRSRKQTLRPRESEEFLPGRGQLLLIEASLENRCPARSGGDLLKELAGRAVACDADVSLSPNVCFTPFLATTSLSLGGH